MIRTRPLLLLLIVAGAATAEQPWEPHAHPALVERRIVGFTEPVRRLALAAEIAGRLETVHLEAGERVPEDGLAVVLDRTVVALAAERARLEAEQAAARHTELQEMLALQDENLAFEQAELARIDALASEGRFAVRERDALANRVRVARQELTTMRARLAQAELAVAGAALRQREIAAEHDKHLLHLPPGWTVSDRLLEAGAVVQPGEAILHAVDLHELRVRVLLGEAEVQTVRSGEARLRFTAHPGSPPRRPVLHHVDPDHDPVSRKRLVEFRLPAAACLEASGGLMAELVLAVREPADAVLVPRNHVVQTGDGHAVHLVGRAAPLPVRVYRGDATHLVLAGDGLPAEARLQAVTDAP